MNDRLVWIDCEMTGLDLGADALIEVAALVTDFELNVIGDGVDVVIKPPQEALDQMDDFVRNMHTVSGLLEELDNGVTMQEAEEQVLAYIKKHCADGSRPPLAGNTVATDRAFLARDMPTLEGFLHYRIVDVSSIKELARRWYPRTYFNAPAKTGNHRALADIQESIEELRYYRAAVFVPAPGPDSQAARALATEHGALTGANGKAEEAARARPRPSRARRPTRVRPPPRTRDTARPPGGSTPGNRYTLSAWLLTAHAERGRRDCSRSRAWCSSVGRAPGCGPGSRGFKSRRSPRCDVSGHVDAPKPQARGVLRRSSRFSASSSFQGACACCCSARAWRRRRSAPDPAAQRVAGDAQSPARPVHAAPVALGGAPRQRRDPEPVGSPRHGPRPDAS